jgi:hypothetical protein
MRTLNLALKFLLELAALVAYAATAIHFAGWIAGSVLAAVAVTVVIAIWGRWAAPRATRRLRPPARIPLELVVLGGAAVALAFWLPWVALAGAVVIALNAILLTVFRQWEG